MFYEDIKAKSFLGFALSSIAVMSAAGTDLQSFGSNNDSEKRYANCGPMVLLPPANLEIALANIGQGTSFEEFKAIFSHYVALGKIRQARAQWLQSIANRDVKLAETVLLFAGNAEGMSKPGSTIDRAFTHYVIHTTEQLGTMTAPGPHQLASAYAQTLEIKRKTNISCNEQSLIALKEAGVLINRSRYGREDVVPTAVFDFEYGSAYSRANAMWMAELSALAYHDQDLVKAQLARWEFESTVWFSNDKTDAQAFVTTNDRYVVVVFRGTESVRDWRIDLTSSRSPVHDGRGSVHKGFQSALDSIWKDELEKLVTSQLGDKELFIAGHSLGAALAQLAAYRFEQEGAHVTAVYVYGSPRLGDKDFVRDYDARLSNRSFRHVNHKDIVTRTPPRWLGFGDLAQMSAWNFAKRTGHELTLLVGGGRHIEQLPSSNEMLHATDDEKKIELERQLKNLEQALQATTRYLHTDPSQGPGMSYNPTTEFERGAFDDHGVYEYLFKIGCAVIDDRFTAAGVRVPEN